MLILIAALLLAVSCDKSVAPEENLGATELIIPLDQENLTDRTPKLQWAPIENALSYEVVVDDTSSFSSSEFHSVNIQNTECTTVQLSPGLYFWRVRAKNSDWSEVWCFTILASPGIEIEWVPVEGGPFQMGSGESGESPIHPVILSGFQISKYEITNQQYCDFLNNKGVIQADGCYNETEYIDINFSRCQIGHDGSQFMVKSGSENLPVIDVTWYGAEAFCEWMGGRLPTEAEWEFSSRGGNQSEGTTYSGSNDVNEVAWFKGNSGGFCHPVGLKQPNELGLYDMTGNVNEWCKDWWDGDYYSISVQEDPQGPPGGMWKVLRGGSWFDQAYESRCTYRHGYGPDGKNVTIGFRCVKKD
jgi:formylglycine-generating enzyme required for sulfatase activity